jgi:hypothetical protein
LTDGLTKKLLRFRDPHHRCIEDVASIGGDLAELEPR